MILLLLGRRCRVSGRIVEGVILHLVLHLGHGQVALLKRLRPFHHVLLVIFVPEWFLAIYLSALNLGLLNTLQIGRAHV